MNNLFKHMLPLILGVTIGIVAITTFQNSTVGIVLMILSELMLMTYCVINMQNILKNNKK